MDIGSKVFLVKSAQGLASGLMVSGWYLSQFCTEQPADFPGMAGRNPLRIRYHRHGRPRDVTVMSWNP